MVSANAHENSLFTQAMDQVKHEAELKNVQIKQHFAASKYIPYQENGLSEQKC